ncbi:hypothetical protein [Asticcacaulis excentricus]|uniref:Uncharacterized protein n=1 Tax=Asticcacaulis excentricus (strain ATCC 15261 / DSM 4724 / KCTC 12464 / NCIMB 9791 / VKM B-1370 / CB 48) TaxID=573065 RepID=E8RNJ7_ASTEC|nr:hypothetical protein [Asticcacaulis excentricus]ADU11828.1 hypothetical protein Astex_0127 [Asticcacaulis excentricus CB 48]
MSDVFDKLYEAGLTAIGTPLMSIELAQQVINYAKSKNCAPVILETYEIIGDIEQPHIDFGITYPTYENETLELKPTQKILKMFEIFNETLNILNTCEGTFKVVLYLEEIY